MFNQSVLNLYCKNAADLCKKNHNKRGCMKLPNPDVCTPHGGSNLIKQNYQKFNALKQKPS